MPELNWVGKNKVITHHLDVPYRVLDRHTRSMRQASMMQTMAQIT